MPETDLPEPRIATPGAWLALNRHSSGKLASRSCARPDVSTFAIFGLTKLDSTTDGR